MGWDVVMMGVADICRVCSIMLRCHNGNTDIGNVIHSGITF